MKNLKTIPSLALSASLIGALAAPHFAQARGVKPQIATIIIDGSGFHPATLNLKAGREARITFVSKGASCANQFSIPALKRTINLEPGQKKTIQFTPKKGGSIALACSMNMFKAKVVSK